MYRYYRFFIFFILTLTLNTQFFAYNIYNIDNTLQNPESFNKLGNHVIVEFTQCKNLNAYDQLEDAIIRAAHAAGATLLTVKTHQFDPAGMTGVAILAESHISVHTWPEYGYTAVDIFTCGEHVNIFKAFHVLREFFQAENMAILKIDRGFNL